MRLTAAKAGFSLAVVIALSSSSSWADPGLEAVFSIGQRLEDVAETGDDTQAEDYSQAVTDLSFGLSSVTRSQKLDAQIDSDLLYRSDEAFDFGDRFARIGYERSSRRALLRSRLSYTEADIDDAILQELFDEETETTELVLETGTGKRRSLVLDTSLALNRGGPFAVDLRHGYRKLTYSGTVDADLQDSVRQDLGVTGTLQLSPTASLAASASWDDLDQEGEDGTQRTTTRYGIDASYELSKTTSVTAGVNLTDIETNTEAEDDGGFGFSLGLSRQRPNGTTSTQFSQTETVNGARRQVQLTRSFGLKRGDAALSLGATQTEGFSVEPLVSANLDYEVSPASTLNLALSQISTTNNDDAETVRTQLRAGYQLAINDVSSLNGNFSYAQQAELAEDGEDQETFRASLSYRRDLAADLDLVTGYEYRNTVAGSGGSDRSQRTVFLSLEKAFRFRP